MKFNYSKLRGTIVEKYHTIGRLAKKLGKSDAWLSAKLNNKGDFTQTDIVKIMDLLGINKKDISIYFFS